MSKSPAFLFYVDKFVQGTLTFTAEETGAYILLLCYQWDNEFLPFDEKQLKIISRLSGRNASNALRTVLKKFRSIDNVGYANERLEQERQTFNKKREKYSERAANAAKVRWGNDATSNALSNATSIEQASPKHDASMGITNTITNTTITKVIDYKGANTPLEPPDKEKKNKEVLTFDFLDIPENAPLKDAFRKFYKYRVNEKKKGFKLQSTLETSFEYLKKLSSGDPAKADEIVTKCIANGWQGLQPIDYDNNSRKIKTDEGGAAVSGRKDTFGNDTGLANKSNGRGRNYLDTGHGNAPRRDFKIFDFSEGVSPDSPAKE